MLLNKRNIISGIRCQKALFLEKFRPELKMALTDAEKKRLDDGIFVGQEARKYFPEGVLIEAKSNQLELAVKQTAEALKSGAHTIFEAAISDNEIIVRPDVFFLLILQKEG